MDAGFGGGDAPFPFQLGHQAVVLGELVQLAVPEEIGAGVAHVDDLELGDAVDLDRGHRRDGRAHAPQGAVAVGLLQHGPVGEAHRLDQSQLTCLLPQGVDRDLAGDVAGGMTPHPVGHDPQAVLGMGGVLIDGPDTARVGGCSPSQLERHQGSTSSTVLPIRTMSPRFTTTVPVSFWPLT